MEFRVLGPLEVVEGEHRYSLGGPKQRAVLAMLIASAGLPVSVDTLIDGIYGDEASERAHRSIHTFVSNLRSDLGDVIERRGEGYVLTVDRSAIDAFRFEELIDSTEGSDDSARIADELRRALAMWRGLPYVDVEVRTKLAAEITRLNELRVSATERRIDAELASGRHAALIAELESLTKEYPLREHFIAQQMIALYRSGRQAEALRAYGKASKKLVEETGLAPSPELRDLESRVLEQDPSLLLEARSSIRHAAIVVADVADPAQLGGMDPKVRGVLIGDQARHFAAAVAGEDGDVFANRGSAIYAIFSDAQKAVSAAATAQQVLAVRGAPMRVAVSVGEVETRTDSDIAGPPVNRAAALVGAAHGGQILLGSAAHRALTELGKAGWVIRSLGPHSFAGLDDSLVVHQLVVDGLPGDFPPLRMAAIPPSLPGAASGLPGYELREEVGSGVFGVVHRAYQPSVGREVAVKIIRPEFANHPDFIRRFEVEAQLVARLEHPHIVPLYDYWREPEGAFLVMRWFGGGSLADRLRRGPLEIAEINDLVAQIVPALAYAHRNGVVHRDIKAANVLLDHDGNVYLSDFGIAEGRSSDGAVADDVQSLGEVIRQCAQGSDVPVPVSEFLLGADEGQYSDLASLMDGWAVAVGESPMQVGYTPTRNPYKGLGAFGEFDAADFHGRDEEIGALVSAVADRRLVAVVGPSGIGKSSVVRAGLIPALRSGALPGSERWLITDMVPGAHPVEELATAMLRVATQSAVNIEEELRTDARGLVRASKRCLPEGATLLVVVDQFEELFTLVDSDETRRAFLDLLQAAVDDERADVRIVLTMRADFFDQPLRFGAFGDLLRSATVTIATPTEKDLRSIITRPAAGVGVAFESGLVERMIAEVKDQPGALPLLEFSLAELFADRESDLLAGSVYEASGGVRGALGRRAELIHRAFDDATKDTVQRVFLRLLALSEGETATRRRVRTAELYGLGVDASIVDSVLDAFRLHRLLTTDRDPVTRGPTVEVAHEALLTEWPRLADWIESQSEDLRLRARLASAVSEWESAGRAESHLLRAGRLELHLAWTAETELSLTSVEHEFLELSQADEDEQRAQRRRVRRRVLAGFGAAALVASVLAIVASAAQRRSEDQAALAIQSEQRAVESAADANLQRELAEVEAEAARQAESVARARELANAALVALDEDPELTLLLALEAASLDLNSATTALHQGLFNHRTHRRFQLPDHSERGEIEGAFSPNAKWIAAGDADAVHMFSVDDPTDEPTWTFTSAVEGVELRTIGFDSTSSQLVVAASWTSAAVVPPDAARDQLGLYGLAHDDGSVVSFHPYPAPEECYVFSVSQSPPTVDFDVPVALHVGKPGTTPGAAQCAGNVYMWDLRNDTVSFVSAFSEGVFRPTGVTMSADGSLIALGEDATRVVDLASGEVALTFPEFPASAVLNRDGSRLLAGFGRPGFADLVLIDTSTGDVLTKFQTENEVFTVGFLPDESGIFTAGFDSTIRIFSVEGAELTRLLGPTAFAKKVQVDASGERLASFSDASDIRVWDTGDIGYEVERLTLSSPRPLFNYRLGTYVGGDRVAIRHLGGSEVFNSSTFESIHLHDDLEGQDAALSPDGRFMAGQIVLARDVPLPAELVVADGPVVADVWGSVAIVDADSGSVIRALPGLCDVWSWWATAEPTPVGDCAAGPWSPYPDFSRAIEWSPDGTMLIFEGSSHGYLVWDALTGDLLHEHQPPADYDPWGFAPAFSPDSRYVLYGDKAGDRGRFEMIVADTTSWDSVARIDMPAVWDVIEFTDDGLTMVVGFQDGFVRFYDTTTWMEKGAPIEAQGFISSISVSEDGSRAALSDGNGYFTVYDIETRGAIEEYRYGVRMQDVEYLNDDQRILLVPRYQSPFVISTDTNELVSLARPRLTRTYTQDECATYGLDPCPTLDEVRAGL